MSISNIFGIIYSGVIVTLAVIAGKVDPIKEPFRVDVCLVASGPNGEDMDTNIWNDQIERYFEKYPGSYCGKCGAEKECP